MRATLLALTEELRRLRTTGVKTVAVSPETLAALTRQVRRRAATAPAAPAQVAGTSPAVASLSPPAPRATPERKAAVVTRAPAPAALLPPLPWVVLPAGDKATRWAGLKETVLGNAVCAAQVSPGKKVVLGTGSLEAELFFCGEAPGEEDEIAGEPFVGPAGQLLTRMIQAMGLAREQVYIGTILNWRPAMPTTEGREQIGTRPPTPEEMAYCLPFLRAQIEIVQPKVIIALGATAAKGLLGADSFQAVGDVRGKWHTFAGIPLMVTYHPSYILRNQSNRSKRMIWEDLLKVMEKTGLPISAKQQAFFLDRA